MEGLKIKDVLLVLGGFGIGATVGALITRVYLERLHEEQIEAIHLAAYRRIKEHQSCVGENPAYDFSPTDTEHEKEKEFVVGKTQNEDKKMDYEEDYNDDEEDFEGDDEGYNPEPPEEWYGILPEDELVCELLPRDESRNIYLISEQEYIYTNLHYTKSEINYYRRDNVLCDELDERLEDPEEIVGPDALTSFGKGSGEATTVYVRNKRLEIDYQVFEREESYQEAILGVEYLSEPGDFV